MPPLKKLDFTLTLFLIFVSFLKLQMSDGQSLPEYDCTGNVSGVCKPPEVCMDDFMYKCPIPGSSCCPEAIDNTTVGELRQEEVDDELDDELDGEMDDEMSRSMERASGECRIRPMCDALGGYCVRNGEECGGKLYRRFCKGKCSCCVPANFLGTCPLTGKPGVPCEAPQSCAGYGNNLNGIYEICPVSNCPPVKVRCMDDGWTVVLNRDLSLDKRCDFVRDWEDYKKGFCNPSGEYWIGNNVLAQLSSNAWYSQTMEITGITSSGETRTLKYNYFYVYGEYNNYLMYAYGYDNSSTGIDLFENPPNYNIQIYGRYFTTYDRDNDGLGSENCCARTGGGGWWYNSCSGILATKTKEIEWYFWSPNEYGPQNVEKLYMRVKPNYWYYG